MAPICAQWLLQQGYEVIGLMRRSASSDIVAERLRWLGILSDVRPRGRPTSSIFPASSGQCRTITRMRCTILARRASLPHRGDSPYSRGQVTGLGAANMLEAVRIGHPQRPILPGFVFRDVWQDARSRARTRLTPFHPRSPYAVAKLYAHWMTINYRESFGLFTSSGILFNHESPLRGIEFVTRKVTDGCGAYQAWAGATNCRWGTWTHGATGGIQGIMSVQCG